MRQRCIIFISQSFSVDLRRFFFISKSFFVELRSSSLGFSFHRFSHFDRNSIVLRPPWSWSLLSFLLIFSCNESSNENQSGKWHSVSTSSFVLLRFTRLYSTIPFSQRHLLKSIWWDTNTYAEEVQSGESRATLLRQYNPTHDWSLFAIASIVAIPFIQLAVEFDCFHKKIQSIKWTPTWTWLTKSCQIS